MSSLGYHHDSMLLLSSAGSSTTHTSTELNNHPMLPKEEGGTAEIMIVQNRKYSDEKVISTNVSDPAKQQRYQQERQRRQSTKKSSYGQYTGFAVDYAEYEKFDFSYDKNNNESIVLLGKAKKNRDDFLCCLFPWASKNPADKKVDNDKKEIGTEVPKENGDSAAAAYKMKRKEPLINNLSVNEKSRKILTKDDALEESNSSQTKDFEGGLKNSGVSDDEISSTGSEAYGEKLTENERAAVLARLRLASPERTAPTPIAATPVTKSKSPKNHSILTDTKLMNNDRNNNRKNGLFLDLEGVSGVDKLKNDNNENLIIVVDDKAEKSLSSDSIPSPEKKLKSILRKGGKKDITKDCGNDGGDGASLNSGNSGNGRRRSLFPQQRQYSRKINDKTVSFASMARVMTVKSRNEMSGLDKSHVWWQKNDYEEFKTTGRLIAKAICEGGSEIWLASNEAWQNNLNKKGKNKQTTIDESRSSIRDGKVTHDKWWHKFGHSRRGLEHIASSTEGRERQATLQKAIRAVTEEQRRQKMYRREDPEKLRNLSLQYTTWARDLALAAAASDAEAVRVDFDENRRSREFYLLKNARAQKRNGYSAAPKTQVPSFMSPSLMTKTPQILDQNTSTQIRFRRRNSFKSKSSSSKPSGTVAKSLAGSSSSGIKQQPINDSKSTDMAKKAAGFGAGQSDVSRILSGMGADNTMRTTTMVKERSHQKIGAH